MSTSPRLITTESDFTVMLAKRLAADPRDFHESPYRQLVGTSLFPEAYATAPDPALRQLRSMNLLGGRVTRPSPPVPGECRPSRNPAARWAIVAAAAAPTTTYRTLAPWPDAAAMSPQIARTFGVLTPSALDFAAAYQFPVPAYVGHGDHVRTADEHIGHATDARYDRRLGVLLACLHVRSAEAQRRIEEKHLAGTPQGLSIQFRGYKRGDEWVLFEQLCSIDTVEVGACPAARVLGPWDDREALLASLIPEHTTSAATSAARG